MRSLVLIEMVVFSGNGHAADMGATSQSKHISSTYHLAAHRDATQNRQQFPNLI